VAWFLSLFEPILLLHIPDGFLSLGMSIACWILAIVLVGFAVPRSASTLGERQVPLMGVMAAFIFAAQMINFPIVGGTSGHLLGGALAAITLGPWAGMLVMTSVLGVQGLIFQDGGLLAMGANILNMGLLTALVGYGIYRAASGQSTIVRLVVAAVAAWLSVMAAALATSLQLWLSGTVSLDVVVPAMLGIHALIAGGEAIITVAALAFLMRVRPDLIEAGAPSTGGRGWVVAGVAVALAVVLLAPLASADPDGLERVAEDMGFIEQSTEAPYEVLPDYTIPALGEGGPSTVVAGMVGALIVAGVAVGAGYMVRRQRQTPSPGGAERRTI
jgi:cobalt/nickel transport system permease protein